VQLGHPVTDGLRVNVEPGGDLRCVALMVKPRSQGVEQPLALGRG
jgi:hypothetical protein